MHKDQVTTDDDFISSVIYRPHHSSSAQSPLSLNDVSQPSPCSTDGKKKLSTIRCKLCCESFVEDKEYLKHLHSCRAETSVTNTALRNELPRKTATRAAAASTQRS